MNIRKKTLLLACLLTLLASALAAEYLTAGLDGNLLSVRWPALIGECTLTVYDDGWPVTAMKVDGASGGAKLALGEVKGRITVRLKTPLGILAADVAARGREQTPRPTPTQRPERTSAPTQRPAGIPVPTRQPPAATVRPTGTAPGGATRPGLAAQVVAEVNAEREKQGLGRLREDEELNRAAAVRARELAETFSHTRPNGESWSTVSGSALGENIARGQRTAERVMASWMSSASHRANILRAGYGSTGVCAYIYDGVTYWVQLFGR